VAQCLEPQKFIAFSLRHGLGSISDERFYDSQQIYGWWYYWYFYPDSFDVRIDCDIIFTIVTRLEIKQIEDAVGAIDPKAFMYVQSIKEATGGILKTKAHPH
jgi:hypothetical protein